MEIGKQSFWNEILISKRFSKFHPLGNKIPSFSLHFLLIFTQLYYTDYHFTNSPSVERVLNGHSA